jgi:hypothetical protein
MTSKFLYRKDLARMLELTVPQVAYQEKNLGLSACRQDLNKRVVRYPAAAALAALRRRNLLPLDAPAIRRGRLDLPASNRARAPAQRTPWRVAGGPGMAGL